MGLNPNPREALHMLVIVPAITQAQNANELVIVLG